MNSKVQFYIAYYKKQEKQVQNKKPKTNQLQAMRSVRMRVCMCNDNDNDGCSCCWNLEKTV